MYELQIAHTRPATPLQPALQPHYRVAHGYLPAGLGP